MTPQGPDSLPPSRGVRRDPDATGPLPAEEVLARQMKGAEATGEMQVTPAVDGEPAEPANAPGWETVPVAGRVDSATQSGSNEFLSWGARSDVGLVRDHNEDAILVDAPLFCVCDGMGGHEAGEVASAVAVEAIARERPDGADDILLGVAVERANAAVLEAAEQGRGRPGMGCTATAVLIDKARMAIAHVGDSRVYVLHAGTLVRVTHDHSFVEELVDAGEITVGEARLHPNRSIITRALGSDPNMYADHFTLDVEAGDRIIVCSDGLSSMLSDHQIETVAVSSVTPQGAVDNLVADALAQGGHDNVSVIVVDVLDDGTASEHHRRLVRSATAWVLVALGVVLALAVAGFLVVSNTFYLGTSDGNVAIYQGLRNDFMGRRLSSLAQVTDVEVDDLPEALQEQLEEGIYVGGLGEAEDTVRSYRDQIADDLASETQTARNAAAEEGGGQDA